MLASVSACAPHGQEQRLLEQFFSASRLRDRTALERISTVIFEPAERGTVTSFTISDVVERKSDQGQIQSKQVTVSAPVRLPNGDTATRKIILVLQFRERWIVTGFTMVSS